MVPGQIIRVSTFFKVVCKDNNWSTSFYCRSHYAFLLVSESASQLPCLGNDQELKLKQLTVLTLAETMKVLAEIPFNAFLMLLNIEKAFSGCVLILSQVLPYDLLMKQLDISNVRELEDMLINDCMYAVSIR